MNKRKILSKHYDSLKQLCNRERISYIKIADPSYPSDINMENRMIKKANHYLLMRSKRWVKRRIKK